MPSTLTRSDYEDCLIYFYFGPGEDRLRLCVRRAYGDFKRTLTNITNHPEARERAEDKLYEALSAAREINMQEQFDNWHQETCCKLACIYKECGYPKFSVGQGQKWINMTFKYIFVMGDNRVAGFSHLYDLCHIPFDNVSLDALQSYGLKPFDCAWSRVNNYNVYFDRQCWVRNNFNKMPPLDVEFRLWMGQSLPEPPAGEPLGGP